jgi:hypothetical protein
LLQQLLQLRHIRPVIITIETTCAL